MEYKLKAFCISALLILLQVNEIFAESGYELWLRYHLIEDVALKRYYQIKNSSIVFTARTQKQLVAKTELYNGLKGLLGFTIQETHDVKDNCLLVGNVESSPLITSLLCAKELDSLGDEGYIIRSLQIEQKSDSCGCEKGSRVVVCNFSLFEINSNTSIIRWGVCQRSSQN